jgi:hypothetical protein
MEMLAMAAAFGPHIPVATPQGRFNAGAQDGEKYALPLLGDEVAANIAIESQREDLQGLAGSLDALRKLLAKENPAADELKESLAVIQNVMEVRMRITKDPKVAGSLGELSGSLNEMAKQINGINRKGGDVNKQARIRLVACEAYGLLTNFVGTALLISLSGGKVTEEDLPKYVALRNLLARAYMRGVTLAQMRDSVMDSSSESDSSSDKLKILRGYIGNGKTIAEVAASIEGDFLQMPLEDIPADYLSLAARAMLMPLKAELAQRILSDESKRAVQENVRMIEQMLQAG